MITAHRREYVPCAIACFQAQTWPDRELIVYDNGGSPVADLLPPDPRIRYFHRPRSLPDVSIGVLRNIAIDVAQGEWIATWDDDDWSAPGRLEHQVYLSESSPRPELVGYSSMYFFDELRAGGAVWKYSADVSNYAIGTSFFFSKELWRTRPFEDRDVGEDNHFQEALWVATADATDPIRMVARSHERGSHHRHMHGEQWSRLDADADAAIIQQVKGCFR